MQQVKIFKALEYDIETMEKQVNDWLTRSGARVLSMTGNIAPQSDSTSKPGGGGGGMTGGGTHPSDVILFLLYEKP